MGNVPEDIGDIIQMWLGDQYKILSSKSIGGGCINETRKLITTKGIFFLKWNKAKIYPGMFQKEELGLTKLKGASSLYIPSPLLCGDGIHHSFLLMEWVESDNRMSNYWENAGVSLAGLHKKTAESYGLDHDNYIGSLEQKNTPHSEWTEFFVTRRIEPQLRQLPPSLYEESLSKAFNRLSNRLEEIFPPTVPSLLHGDLWSGNIMVGPEGQACLVDPAVYFGHREMEIAFTRLFGGFDPDFYRAYHETWPLEKGFESRIDVYNLYPLLVHANLFGASYLLQVKAILKRFL